MAMQSNGGAAQTEESKSSASAFNMGASNFNMAASEFVPVGTIVNTKEQFPDLMALSMESKPGKKSKKNKQNQAAA